MSTETGALPITDDVLERLKTHDRMRGVLVIEDGLDGEEDVPRDTFGNVNPYVVLTFGDRSQVASSQRGIVGTRGDMRRLVFGVEIYANTPREKRRVADDVFDILEGYAPFGLSPVEHYYSGRIENPMQVRMGHARFGIGQLYRLFVDPISLQSKIG